MRLLIVAPDLGPGASALRCHILDSAHLAAGAGLDVTVLTVGNGRRSSEHELVDGVRFLRVPALRGGTGSGLALGVYRCVAWGAWNLAHIHSCDTAAAQLAMLAAERHGTPYVVTPHRHGGRYHGWKFRRPHAHRLLRCAREVIAVDRVEREQLIAEFRLAPSAVTIIPTRPSTAGEPAPEGGIRTIAVVGPLADGGCHREVLKALPLVLKARPGTRLAIVGEGPGEPELRRLGIRLGVGDKVDFTSPGPSDDRRVTALLAQASVVVLANAESPEALRLLHAATRTSRVLTPQATYPVGDGGTVDVACQIIEQLPATRPDETDDTTWQDCGEALLGVYLRHATFPEAHV